MTNPARPFFTLVEAFASRQTSLFDEACLLSGHGFNRAVDFAKECGFSR
jgi:hypothetical protein